MTIYRALHNKNYTTVNNTIVKDNRLSWKAKGIWLYAFSKRDDWSFHVNDLIKQSTDGKDSVRGGLIELEKAGYLRRSRERKEDGRYGGADWIFYETPQDFKECLPKPDFPTLDFPVQENPPLVSTDTLASTEQQQLAPGGAAAVSSSASQKKEPKKPEPKPVKIYEILEPIDIPKPDKVKITSTYDEDTVKNAIAWATNPQNPPKKGMVASINFACAKGLKFDPQKNDQSEANKAYAEQYDGYQNAIAYVSTCNDHVQISCHSGTKLPYMLKYLEHGFREQLDSTLRKYGFEVINKKE